MAIGRHNGYVLFAANAPVFCDYRQRRWLLSFAHDQRNIASTTAKVPRV